MGRPVLRARSAAKDTARSSTANECSTVMIFERTELGASAGSGRRASRPGGTLIASVWPITRAAPASLGRRWARPPTALAEASATSMAPNDHDCWCRRECGTYRGLPVSLRRSSRGLLHVTQGQHPAASSTSPEAGGRLRLRAWTRSSPRRAKCRIRRAASSTGRRSAWSSAALLPDRPGRHQLGSCIAEPLRQLLADQEVAAERCGQVEVGAQVDLGKKRLELRPANQVITGHRHRARRQGSGRTCRGRRPVASVVGCGSGFRGSRIGRCCSSFGKVSRGRLLRCCLVRQGHFRRDRIALVRIVGVAIAIGIHAGRL